MMHHELPTLADLSSSVTDPDRLHHSPEVVRALCVCLHALSPSTPFCVLLYTKKVGIAFTRPPEDGAGDPHSIVVPSVMVVGSNIVAITTQTRDNTMDKQPG